MEKDFTVVALGQKFTMFNFDRVKGVDSALIFEALPQNSGFSMNIYMLDMTADEVEDLASPNIYVRVLKDTPYFVLPVARFGNTSMLFEIIFDPFVYEDNRAMQLALDCNMVQIIGVDSRTNIVKSLRFASMPKRLREIWLTAWTAAREVEDFSNKYKRWTQDIASRYTLQQLWDRAVYVGKFGDK